VAHGLIVCLLVSGLHNAQVSGVVAVERACLAECVKHMVKYVLQYKGAPSGNYGATGWGVYDNV
jgi:hypothetical protein